MSGGWLRRVGLVAAVTGLSVALAACEGGSSGHAVGDGACVATLRFNGVMYEGVNVAPVRPHQMPLIPKSHTRLLGRGVSPPCRDTNHSKDIGHSVNVAQIDQFEADVMVADMSTGWAYLARGAKLPASLWGASWFEWITP
jgi:hypothetical protein